MPSNCTNVVGVTSRDADAHEFPDCIHQRAPWVIDDARIWQLYAHGLVLDVLNLNFKIPWNSLKCNEIFLENLRGSGTLQTTVHLFCVLELLASKKSWVWRLDLCVFAHAYCSNQAEIMSFCTWRFKLARATESGKQTIWQFLYGCMHVIQYVQSCLYGTSCQKHLQLRTNSDRWWAKRPCRMTLCTFWDMWCTGRPSQIEVHLKFL